MLKKTIKVLLIIVAIIIALIFVVMILVGGLLLLLDLELDGRPIHYETMDVADYRVITGTHNDEEVKKRIEMYFPATIEEYFVDVEYVYHATLLDDVAAEAYLEFTIHDEEKFEEHVTQLLQDHETTAFRYDESFQEYVLWDYLFVSEEYNEDTKKVYWRILGGCIQKVLINNEENRLIYVLLFVDDGGVTDSNNFWCYFDRFNINPREYQQYTKELIDQNPAWLDNDLY